jgi:beta-phosphoglucomutase-like phosphatase (HAD superfamily)
VTEATIDQLQQQIGDLREQLAALVRRGGSLRPGLDDVTEELADAVKVLGQGQDAERRQLTPEQANQLRRRITEVQTQLAKSPSRRPGGEQYVNLTPKQVQPKWATVEAAKRIVEADLLKLEEAGLGGGPDKDQIAAAKDRVSAVARQRLNDLMAAGDPLPVWLATAVGAPPKPDPEPWLKAAHNLLSYRLEHGVNDPILPLGGKPGADDAYGARRAGEYKKIAEELNKLHELGGKSDYKL